MKAESSSATEAEKPADIVDSSMIAALPVPRSVSPASTVKVSNLDRLMESVTPYIEARYLSEVYKRIKLVSLFVSLLLLIYIFSVRHFGVKTLNSCFSFRIMIIHAGNGIQN